jgi:hypothetical protein
MLKGRIAMEKGKDPSTLFEQIVTRVEQRQMLNGIAMEKGKDPSTLFEQICSVENKYNTATNRIDPDELIAVVLAAAPPEYQSVLTSEQRRRGTQFTIEDLEAVMNQYWRQTDSVKGKLSTFDGYCFHCKKKGRKANICHDKKTWSSESCFNCGKKGHCASDCWDKEENKSKRPSA